MVGREFFDMLALRQGRSGRTAWACRLGAADVFFARRGRFVTADGRAGSRSPQPVMPPESLLYHDRSAAMSFLPPTTDNRLPATAFLFFLSLPAPIRDNGHPRSTVLNLRRGGGRFRHAGRNFARSK
jgi:hypothetical protein